MGTKTSKIIENLGQRLRNGEWESSSSLPPVSRLSGQYKVSPGTVALALRSLEREGLVKVVPRHGIFSTVENRDTNGAAQACPTIGIYGNYAAKKDSGYMGRLTGGILKAAHGLGGPVLMLPKVAEGEALDRRHCERQGVKGILFLGGQYLEKANRLREEGFPVITANMPVGATAMNYVSFDHAIGVRSMTERFAAIGHRRIAVLTYETTTRGLYASFKLNFIDALCRADIHYNPTPYWRLVDKAVELDFQERENALLAIVEELMALPSPPTAIFCLTILAEPLLKCLERKGLKVPADVSVICSAYNEEGLIPTSGFVLPFEKLGQRLVEGLHEVIRNPFHSVQELMPLPFFDKGTIAPPAKGKTS